MKNNIFVSDLIFYNDTKEETLNFIEMYDLKNLEFFLEPRDFNHTEKFNFLIKHAKLENVSFHGPYRFFNIDCSNILWEELKLNFVEALICCKKIMVNFLFSIQMKLKEKTVLKKRLRKS